MDYKKLVTAAGYDGEKAGYIARKLEARQVPKENLNALGSYFRGMSTLAGESLHELGQALYDAAFESDATDAAKELAKKEKVDLKTIKGSGASGRITKADVENEVNEDGNS